MKRRIDDNPRGRRVDSREAGRKRKEEDHRRRELPRDNSRRRRDDSRSNRNGRKYDNISQQRRSVSPSRSNHSSDIDDSVGHFEGGVGSVILDRYTIIKELGTGTFGKVYYCSDSKHNDHVALKIVRKIEKYVDSAKIEADILSVVFKKQKLCGTSFCMKMYSHFSYRGHYCMVCEPLGTSLYDYIKSNDYVGFPLSQIRDISRQLLEAMKFLESIELVHTDLKLENILFMYSSSTSTRISFRGKDRDVTLPSNTRIKVIDFGGATFANDRDKSTIVNTRQYRGPEVTLELGWSYPSDIWSVGCIIAEAYQGDLLFATHDDIEHLALMEKLLGPFPSSMIDASPVRRDLFRRDNTLRIEELSQDSYRELQNMPSSLRDVFNVQEEDADSGIVELMTGLLTLNPIHRMKPQDALKLPFFHA